MTKRVALILVGALVLAGCTNGSTTPPPSPTTDPFNPVDFNTASIQWLAANVNATGRPEYGGTLEIEGDQPPGALLDPQGEYDPYGFEVERATSRQLVSYPASTNLSTAESIVTDAAVSMPTVSSDGLTYTFTLRSGLMWNTTPPRPVTSDDFARGILRNCDPTLAPNGNPGYYESTIAGYQAFCSAFEGQNPSESAAARAATINAAMNGGVSGISTPNDTTIVFTLTQPASDFNNILALPFASAAPVEYMKYIPLTPGNVLYSDGPYEIKTYNVGHELILDHNPAWSQSTDTIRHQYVNEVDIKVDMVGSDVAENVQNDLTLGAADLEWDTAVPTEDLAKVQANPEYGAFPLPGSIAPYLVFNVQSPNNGGALGNIKVRQALEYAINKVAIINIFGGPSLNEPLNQVIGPGAEGHVAFNDYPTKDSEGDPGKCSRLLKAAGYPNGLTLKDMYLDISQRAEVFFEVQSDLRKCGVIVRGIPVSADYTTYAGPTGVGVASPEGLKTGNWDITDSQGWYADWYGPANGRALIPNLFDGALSFPGPDWGGFDDPHVDALIDAAEAAKTLRAAAGLWHLADERIMADAAFIPFQASLVPIFRSNRVHNAIYYPISQEYDITQVWLSP
jgi:peptide/nickel transport system substrate-binding protein